MKIIVEKNKKKKGLWANIHAKRKRGERPAKPGDKAYPDKEQWNELTKEQLEQIISEEVGALFEQEQTQLELPLPKPEEAVKQSHELTLAAQKELQAKKNTANALNTSNPKLQQAQTAEIRAKQLELDFAKENERKTKETVQQAPQTPVLEQKSNFQKEMSRKGKSWKLRLLSKGKQEPGSAYPNKAPMERSKSAPPGAGGS